MRRYLLFLLATGWLTLPAFSQKPLTFSEVLTFSYGQQPQKKETSVYLDRKTSTWLFTNDDTFGGIAEGLAFVVAYANGTYLLCGTDGVDQKFCLRYRRSVTAPRATTVAGKSTGRKRRFGENGYGWPVLVGLVVSEGIPGGASLKSLSPTDYTIDLRQYRITDARP